MNNFIGPRIPPHPSYRYQHVSFIGLDAGTGELTATLSKGRRWKVERTALTAEECQILEDNLRSTVGPRPSHVIAEPPDDGWRVNHIVQRKRWGDREAVDHVPGDGPSIDPRDGRLLTVYLDLNDYSEDVEVQFQVWKDDQGWIEIPPGQRERAPLTRPDEPPLRFDTQHEDGEGL